MSAKLHNSPAAEGETASATIVSMTVNKLVVFCYWVTHSDKKVLSQSGDSMPVVLHRKVLAERTRKAKHVPNWLS